VLRTGAIPGPTAKSAAVRWTATTRPQVRAEPEGVIDPIGFAGESMETASRPGGGISYYATHPQSYYRTGIPNPIFRDSAFPSAVQCGRVAHSFTGAGAISAAGKYNERLAREPANLAERNGRRHAPRLESTKRQPIAPLVM